MNVAPKDVNNWKSDTQAEPKNIYCYIHAPQANFILHSVKSPPPLIEPWGDVANCVYFFKYKRFIYKTKLC